MPLGKPINKIRENFIPTMEIHDQSGEFRPYAFTTEKEFLRKGFLK
jgi:hypothetical protein